MSVIAIMPPSAKHTHGLINSTVTMPTKCYGEMLINSEGAVVLRCTTCHVEQRAYKQFLEHIFAHYRTETLCLLSASSVPLVSSTPKASVVSPIPAPAEIRRTPRKTRAAVALCNSNNNSKEPLAVINETPKDHQSTNAELRKEPLTVIEDNDSNCDCEPLPMPPLVRKSKCKKKKKIIDCRYRCDLCNTIFSDWTQKCIHMQHYHSDERPYACSDCEMRFSTSKELRMHQRQRHTLQRPFMCNYCGKSFAQNAHMREHERQHEGELVMYNCEHCSNDFVNKTRLREHAAVHPQKERKYECNECNAKFNLHKNFMDHMRVHVNGGAFVCNLCDLTFDHATALWLHKKHVHKVLKPGVKQSKIGAVYEQLQAFMKDAMNAAKEAKIGDGDGGGVTH